MKCTCIGNGHYKSALLMISCKILTVTDMTLLVQGFQMGGGVEGGWEPSSPVVFHIEEGGWGFLTVRNMKSLFKFTVGRACWVPLEHAIYFYLVGEP